MTNGSAPAPERSDSRFNRFLAAWLASPLGVLSGGGFCSVTPVESRDCSGGSP
jgi:hypothetical protein